jgi:hypothetical protein
MIPRTLSASSLNTAELCLARWKAENLNRGASLSNKAADTGTAVHGGLEYFVDWCILKGHKEDWTEAKLREFFEISYMETFRSGDFDAPTFADGWHLCKVWFKRTDLSNRRVLSVEEKLHFPLKTSVGIIPITYIRDRFDELSPPDEDGSGGRYEVVDYKTIRFAPKNSELKGKIQPRIYALATQIEYPQAEQIWVTFDCLRHDPIGSVMFTRDDNARTYRALQKAAERIIAWPDDKEPPETLNSECQYCIRKLFCKTMQSNQLAQGIMAVPPDLAIQKIALVNHQLKALERVQEELNRIIVRHAEEMDLTEWVQPDGSKVKLSVSGRRNVDSRMVANVVGPAIAQRYGNFPMAAIDELLKGDELSDAQKAQLKGLIGKNYSDPSVKVIPSMPMGDE